MIGSQQLEVIWRERAHVCEVDSLFMFISRGASHIGSTLRALSRSTWEFTFKTERPKNSRMNFSCMECVTYAITFNMLCGNCFIEKRDKTVLAHSKTKVFTWCGNKCVFLQYDMHASDICPSLRHGRSTRN